MRLQPLGLLPFKRRKQRDLLDALTAPQPSSRLAMRSSDMFDSSGGSREAQGLQFRHASANQAAVSSLVPDEVRCRRRHLSFSRFLSFSSITSMNYSNGRETQWLQFRHASANQAAVFSLVPDEAGCLSKTFMLFVEH